MISACHTNPSESKKELDGSSRAIYNLAMSDAQPAAAPAPKGPSKLPMILGLLNTLVVLGVLGVLVYTRLLYKRPAITEETEREVIALKVAKPDSDLGTRTMVKFDPFTVNIKAGDPPHQDEGAPPAPGKMHYVNLGFYLEVRDNTWQEQVTQIKPKFMDSLLRILGKMTADQLTTVQGRYILRTKIVDLMNELINNGKKDAEPVATNVFFTAFTVQ